jgi:hypothetical protein
MFLFPCLLKPAIMQSDTRRPKKLASFSERIATYLTIRDGLQVPSEEDMVSEGKHSPFDPLAGFQNQLPHNDVDTRLSFIRHQYHKSPTDSTLEAA